METMICTVLAIAGFEGAVFSIHYGNYLIGFLSLIAMAASVLIIVRRIPFSGQKEADSLIERLDILQKKSDALKGELPESSRGEGK